MSSIRSRARAHRVDRTSRRAHDDTPRRADAMASETENAYERARAANIAKNRAIMVKLGILASDLRAHEGPASSSRGASARGVDDDSKPTRTAKRPRRERATTSTATTSTAVRRSSRSRVAKPSVVERDEDEDEDEDEARDDAAHEVAARAHASRHAGKQARAAIVGTNSYQHTLMRVRTMDDAALMRRVDAIERAKGKHCVTKMRLFARVLYLEGKVDLAGEAAESLERLIEELGDPEEDETNKAREDQAQECAAARAAGTETMVFHCDAATNLEDASVYADVVRIEAEASKESGKPASAMSDVSTINVPNANVWQRAAVRLAGKDGLLRGSGNFVSLSDTDGTYHVERATKEMKQKMIRKPPR
jgi:hypothetical protein